MGIINPFDQGNQVKKTSSMVDDSGPEIRLLVCKDCKTIDVLDDYTGPPEMAEMFDVTLNTLLERHRDGVERIPHVGQMFRVRESSWDVPEAQEQIRRQILAKFDPGAETGLGAEAYALRDTFREDAMRCWTEKHGRTENCGDYKTEKMQLMPNTAAERKEAGIAKFDRHNPATQRYLCEYCPVHSLVQQRQRAKAGLYDQ